MYGKFFHYLFQAGSGSTDTSVLTPPVMTSLTGMRQALHALEAGSPELKRVLFDEANLVYECRVCLNMFRSLANLIKHKRAFCSHRYAQVRHEFSDQNRKPDDGEIVNVSNNNNIRTKKVLIEPEPVPDCCLINPDSWGGDLSTYSPSMELIKTAGILQELQPHQQQILPDRRKTLNAILPRLSGQQPGPLAGVPPPKKGFQSSNSGTLRLEPIYSTNSAVYQSWHLRDAQTGDKVTSVKDINMALQRFVIEDDHVVVGPDGRAVVRPGLNNNLQTVSSKSTQEQGTGSSGARDEVTKEQQQQTDRKWECWYSCGFLTLVSVDSLAFSILVPSLNLLVKSTGICTSNSNIFYLNLYRRPRL